MTAAPAPSPAEQAVIDRFGIFDAEDRAKARELAHRFSGGRETDRTSQLEDAVALSLAADRRRRR